MPDIIANKKTHIVFYRGVEPSEELYPSVELYPSEITNYPDTTIAAGSCNLNQLLCADKFAVGQACAAKFECQIYNLPDVSGNPIEVYQMVDDDISTRESLFYGYVDSCVQDDFGYYRNIVAYDALQYNRGLNISSWWNQWRLSNPNATLQTVFEALLSQVNLSYYVRNGDISDLPNYDLECYTGFTLEAKRWGDMLQDCLRLLCVSAHIDGSGELELIRFNPDVLTVKDISTLYERGASSFEGYTTAKITGVQLMDSLGTLKYIGNLAVNPLTIETTLLSGKTSSELDSICNAIFNEVSDVTFRPADIKMIYSSTEIQLGDYVQTDKGYMYVLSNELSGSMLIQQTISAQADEFVNQVTEDMSNTEFNTSSASTPQYYLSTSETELVGGEWFDECPRFLNNHYYWVRYKTTAPNGIISYSNPLLANGLTEANQLSLTNSSDIIQQADLIATKVSQTDYNGNEIASRINQTATTIDIEASKINFSGQRINMEGGALRFTGTGIDYSLLEFSYGDNVTKLSASTLTKQYAGTPVYFIGGTSGAPSRGLMYLYDDNGDMLAGLAATTSGGRLYLNKNGGIYIRDTSSNYNAQLYVGTDGNGRLILDGNKNITLSGVGGTGYFAGAVTASNISDERLKQNIEDVSDETAKKLLTNIRPRTYQMIRNPEKQRMGFVAQEILETLKTYGLDESLFVYEYDDPIEEDTRYALNYEDLTAALWAGWQMHERIINDIKQELADIKENYNSINTKMEGE